MLANEMSNFLGHQLDRTIGINQWIWIKPKNSVLKTCLIFKFFSDINYQINLKVLSDGHQLENANDLRCAARALIRHQVMGQVPVSGRSSASYLGALIRLAIARWQILLLQNQHPSEAPMRNQPSIFQKVQWPQLKIGRYQQLPLSPISMQLW